MEWCFLKKFKSEKFQKLFKEFNHLDFNVERNVEKFIKKVQILVHENKCFFKNLFKFAKKQDKTDFKLSKKVQEQLETYLEPFIKYFNKINENKINKFYKNIERDKTFKNLDSKFKKNQSKDNYNNLIEYFKDKFKHTRTPGTLMLADDDCVPMYNSDFSDSNYDNYKDLPLKFDLR